MHVKHENFITFALVFQVMRVNKCICICAKDKNEIRFSTRERHYFAHGYVRCVDLMKAYDLLSLIPFDLQQKRHVHASVRVGGSIKNTYGVGFNERI